MAVSLANLGRVRLALGDDAVARLVAEGREAPVDGMIERALESTL